MGEHPSLKLRMRILTMMKEKETKVMGSKVMVSKVLILDELEVKVLVSTLGLPSWMISCEGNGLLEWWS